MSATAFTAAPLAGVAHGFFTREGGVSSGIYAGLNCGPGSADDPAAVAENRARAAAALGGGPLLTLHQVHSATVVTADPDRWAPRPRADAVVTDRPGVILGALAADCAPVLLADAEAGVIGAAHAGWRGALGGVLEATVAAMERLGAQAGRIGAAIGPCISQTAYEVGPEFAARFVAAHADSARFFAEGPGGRPHFDLPGFALARLCAAGVGAAVWTGQCTYADASRFYSFRRATHAGAADYGRMLSAIRL